MSKVFVADCESYDLIKVKSVVQQTIDALGGWDKYIKKNQKVLLKVNLIGPKKAEKAATTNPEFVRAVGQLIQAFGADVYVGDSSGGAIAGLAPTKKSFLVSGIQKVAAEEDFTLINFDEIGPIKKVVEGNHSKELYITKALEEMDVVINLPKMKTHSMCIFTGAIKNLFGAIPGLRKAKYHKDAPDPLLFGEVLADIHHSIKNMKLHIMDGIIAMQGSGPTAGKTYLSGKILVSEDPLAMDRVAIEMMGIDPDRMDILKASINRHIGVWAMDAIEVHGNIEKFENFSLPKRYINHTSNDFHRVKGVIDFFKSVPVINLKKCINCNSCVDSCPVKAIDQETKSINYELCIECLCCHELCMVEAVELKSEKRYVDMIRTISSKFYK